ncbi:hypothetical protein Cgig2_032574 [Carnegiea gigantea]|uniref:Uncharacterized protein n=1 Tax=Carnegiea gigantea TaxID=171969 RepID=A0A9Q1KWG3_9CARY|nr:hypothetical protein Cgig2_032574 [Carnegiea gigantea]
MQNYEKSTQTQSPLLFKVRRAAPELIPPVAPTPKEFKELSDIDDQEGLRFQVPLLQFYRGNESRGRNQDPAKVIREAVGKALVPYYPFAGRLREKAGRKLVVECNGKGVLFIEANADVTLDDFGEEIHPPFPCLEELLFYVPGYGGTLDTPLIIVQVTRLKCGGINLGWTFNHAMADGQGFFQFLSAVAELGRGGQLSVQPIWERHLLCARDPLRVTCVHHEYDTMAETRANVVPLDDNMVHRSFFFGLREMSALRHLIPPDLKSSTAFEVLTACLWRCRTIALQPHPNETVQFHCVVNARSRLNPPAPKGYYGNAIAFSTVLSTAGDLCQKPVGYAVELVKKAKANVTDEYMRSLADFLVINGRPHLSTAGRCFAVSNLTRIGFDELDYGWGLPEYAGTAGEVPGICTFYMPYKNKKRKKGILSPIRLPAPAMERFIMELNSMLDKSSGHPNTGSGSSLFISSSLDISDHIPILLKCASRPSYGGKPSKLVRFENMCATIPDCEDVIAQVRGSRPTRDVVDDLSTKLHNCVAKLTS